MGAVLEHLAGCLGPAVFDLDIVRVAIQFLLIGLLRIGTHFQNPHPIGWHKIRELTNSCDRCRHVLVNIFSRLHLVDWRQSLAILDSVPLVFGPVRKCLTVFVLDDDGILQVSTTRMMPVSGEHPVHRFRC